MAIFGAPIAFEDAPLRACRAALLIHEKLAVAAGVLETKFGIRPRMRIGINTGLAVVGQVQAGADANVTVLGDTVNLASRLQALAEPDSRAWANRACCTNAANASTGSAPSSCRETVRPTASRHLSCPSSK